MNELDISKYTDIAQRRKWWIIIPLLLTLLAGLSYALIAPKVYEAETLILVIPQKVPQSYVRSIVSVSMEDRLRTITLGSLGSVFGVLVATKGLDKTLRFFTEFVSRIGG